MVAEWFTRVGAVVTGPHTPAELKALAASGRLPPDGRVRRGDSGPWVRADSIKGLTFPGPDDEPADEEPDEPDDEGEPAGDDAPTVTRRYPTLRVIAVLCRVFAAICGGFAVLGAIVGVYGLARGGNWAEQFAGLTTAVGSGVWGVVCVIGFSLLAEGISLAIDVEHTLREIRDDGRAARAGA